MVEPGSMIYGNQIEKLPDRNITLAEYLQSWRYFDHVDDQLRFDLKFRPEFIERAQRFLDSVVPSAWKGRYFVRVVIHVRRSDLINPARQLDGWPVPEPDYFSRSMAYFTDCLPRVQFVVISDDINWCKRNIVGENVVYSVGGSPLDDMAIASLCDHAIITVGTYGWWCGWFTSGIVVTQKNFPTPGSRVTNRLRRSDFYKPEWIAL